MVNVMERVYETRNAEKGCAVMDWLNDHSIPYDISLNERDTRLYVFDIRVSRTMVSQVDRFLKYKV